MCISHHTHVIVPEILQVEGSFEAILPREDLEAVHSRILASELVVKESAGGGLSSSTQGGRYDTSMPPLNVRLAAALGLSPLLLPFRCEALRPSCSANVAAPW